MDESLLPFLCCPEDRTPLRQVTPDELEQLNGAIRDGVVKNRLGFLINEEVETALVREDGVWCYPVRNGIPVLLIDEALLMKEAIGHRSGR